MRATLTRCAACAALAAAMLIGASTAQGGANRFGDFDVKADVPNAGVTFFAPGGSGITNPDPFPAPVDLNGSMTYPAEGTGTITADQVRTYLSGLGLNDESFGPGVILKSRGAATISEIEIKADGETVASAQGFAVVRSPSETGRLTAFLPPGWLDNVDPNAQISVRVAFEGTTRYVDRVDMAAAPEPVSMALFGTGLAVLAGMRLRKERKR